MGETMGTQQAGAKRIEYLDAIRGLAALSVVMYHVINSHWAWMTEAKVAMIVFNGADAVAIFFVLSGLVLSYKVFQRDVQIDGDYVKKFAVSRVFRLYPAFLVMFVIYYSVAHFGENYLTLWKDTFLHNPYYFWEEAMLMREHHDLYLPGWTLGVEMALSLLVPFMILIARQGDRLFIFFLLVCMIAGKVYISEFVLLFGLGVLIAKHFDRIHHFQDDAKWWYRNRWSLFPLVLFLFSIRHILHLFPLPGSIRYFLDSILFVSEFVFTGIASALILVYVINSERIQRVLSGSLFSFLGRVSYGVYLSHWLFTKLIMERFDYIMTTYANGSELRFFLLYSAVAVASSLIAGTLIYYLVEQPFIRIGRRVVARLANEG